MREYLDLLKCKNSTDLEIFDKNGFIHFINRANEEKCIWIKKIFFNLKKSKLKFGFFCEKSDGKACLIQMLDRTGNIVVSVPVGKTAYLEEAPRIYRVNIIVPPNTECIVNKILIEEYDELNSFFDMENSIIVPDKLSSENDITKISVPLYCENSYAVDEISFENTDSEILIHVKGWILSKDFVVIVQGDGAEVYRFSGNQKRYDICLSYGVDSSEINYGYEVDFSIPSSCKLLKFYCIEGTKKFRFYTLALSSSKHYQERFCNVVDSVKRSIQREWEMNHFRFPIIKLLKKFIRMMTRRSHNQIFLPDNIAEYSIWLKMQKYRKSKKFSDITFCSLNLDFKWHGKVVYGEKLDLSTIHTDYVCFIGKKCRLYKEFQYYINMCEQYDILYFDHDKNINGERQYPSFKPDFSYDTLHCVNYIGNVFVVKKELLQELDGSQIDLYAYLLKLSEKTNRFGHISHVLYSDNEEVKYHYEKLVLENNPLVSIVIPTKDHVDDLKTCLNSIFTKSTYKNYEILIVNNNSSEKETFSYFDSIQKKYDNVRVIDLNCEFNFSYLNNYAVEHVAKGEYILMLNNDTEVVSDDWLEKLILYASKDGVGSVGAFLMFPDNTIQHAGIIMGKGGVAGHAYSGVSIDTKGYRYELQVPYNVSCCTAACLMVSKKKYLEVGMMNEDLKVAFNDVDFGLKLLEAGYRNVFLPDVKLYHYESKSRGMDKSEEQLKRYYTECDYMKEKWLKYIEHDPYYNGNFLKNNDYCLHD